MGENQTTPPELYPGHAAELSRHLARIAGIEAAAREPLPGPLNDAYANVPFEISGFKVRPLVHYDWVLLTKLDSPVLQHLRKVESDTAPSTPFSDEQAYELVWHFSRPCKTVAAEIAAYERDARRANPALSDGEILAGVRQRFRDRAIEEIGMVLGVVEAGLLVRAVEREIIRAFATGVKYMPRKTESENFTAPPVVPMTGSAGGSITSPASSAPTP